VSAPIYRFIIDRMRGVLLQVESKKKLRIDPIQHWITRPFQGIGIGLLFATKLLSILQIFAGSRAVTSSLIPKGRFQLGQFFMITGITVFISILLSTSWTLDDRGIRYFNKKDQEIKMVGKYAGILMPIIFGSYGILNLFSQYATTEASIYLFKIIVVLYPPFTVFSVAHTYFLRNRAKDFSSKRPVANGGIWRDW
jgi:hypothetical protein